MKTIYKNGRLEILPETEFENTLLDDISEGNKMCCYRDMIGAAVSPDSKERIFIAIRRKENEN